MPTLEFDPVAEVPDQSGRVYVITGATSGIGKTTVLRLAAKNPAQIILTGRSASRATAVMSEAAEISSTTKFDFISCDLNDLESVKVAGAEIIKLTGGRLDVLVCNAGIFVPEHPGTTKQGYEVAFGTNHVSHAALIQLLIPTLTQTASLPSADVRIILVSSAALELAPGIQFPLLKSTMAGFSWVAAGLKRYGQSKLAMRLYGLELAKRFPNITTVTIHPGEIKTEIVDTSPWWSRLIFAVTSNLTPDQGCWNTLWASTANKSKTELQGGWFVPVGKVGTAIKQGHLDLAPELWTWTQAELVGNGFPALEPVS
ncbi:hypothetical protein HKX48_001259 [Thoreauomyces humboldtii]|nr:hypothetical protein HKX48_001259 [Thoreauomyces humboldtii]